MSDVQKYRHPRRPADIWVSFEHGHEIVEAELHDITPEGARIDGDFYLGGPDEITLLMKGYRYPARIVWKRFGILGIRFDQPLDRDTYKALLGHGPGQRATSRGRRVSTRPRSRELRR